MNTLSRFSCFSTASRHVVGKVKIGSLALSIPEVYLPQLLPASSSCSSFSKPVCVSSRAADTEMKTVTRVHRLKFGIGDIPAASNNVGFVCRQPKSYPYRKAWCDVVYQSRCFDFTQKDVNVCHYSSVASEDNLDIDYDSLMSMIKSKNIQLIDVREPEEVEETGMMPGAFNVPLGEVPEALQLDEDEFQKRYGAPKPNKTDGNVIFSCLGGIRSKRALLAAHEIGYRRARHYIGGWEEFSEKYHS